MSKNLDKLSMKELVYRLIWHTLPPEEPEYVEKVMEMIASRFSDLERENSHLKDQVKELKYENICFSEYVDEIKKQIEDKNNRIDTAKNILTMGNTEREKQAFAALDVEIPPSSYILENIKLKSQLIQANKAMTVLNKIIDLIMEYKEDEK